ncbi:hypothetical protein [Kocuria sp. CPCC 205258]|uniref:hypothetical protein n=1 Tax=Kocuria sp. CPCC 205258 TaxID=3073552 RepID=UPI0034D62A2F
MRAISPEINDSITAAHAIGCCTGLVARLPHRNLGPRQHLDDAFRDRPGENSTDSGGPAVSRPASPSSPSSACPVRRSPPHAAARRRSHRHQLSRCASRNQEESGQENSGAPEEARLA